MRIPKGLKKILDKDGKLAGRVLQIVGEVEPILKDKNMPFFPEFTDHGISHVEGVLETAYALMSDSARKASVFGARDAAVLILACLLHDIGMHLTKSGFVSLVSGKAKWQVVERLGDLSWEEMWDDFEGEARRFDERKLNSLFGSMEPVAVPELDSDDWGEKQFKLVGEFVRRHHHRYAHQVALNGLPGPDGELFDPGFLPGKYAELEECFDLAGFVARSHGMAIRSCLGYLEEKYHCCHVSSGVHAVYLMSLVRVADYLQVEGDRAAKQVLAVRALRSPVAQREWRSHGAVQELRTDMDPESLYVRAQPEDVETYLRLREILDGVQEELDCSWAVLGEVYGRFGKEKLDRLGLCLRRVRSNVDDVEKFAETVSYVPCRARFDTAGAELMRLLIEPLYGRRPEIGIRELMQNAVDAVRELEELLRERGELRGIERADISVDVAVTLEEYEEGQWRLTVEDRGIGMSPEILREYFLKAGASLRTSEDWRKVFEDGEGQSRILRSGRFGVGVFAALLLGDRISVSTRHIHEQTGVAFEASLAEEFIEFVKDERAVGTKVSVGIDEKVALKLIADTDEWGWYVLEEPSVERYVRVLSIERVSNLSVDKWIGKLSEEKLRKELHKKYLLPEEGAVLPADWHRIEHEGFRDLQWTYLAKAPELTCNGIVVNRSMRFFFGDSHLQEVSSHNLQCEFNTWLGDRIEFTLPHCSCFDPDGRLPLSLQRTGVTRMYPFVNELRESVVRDFLSYVLVCGPDAVMTGDEVVEEYFGGSYPGLFKHRSLRVLCFVRARSGLTVCEPWLIEESGEENMVGLLSETAYRRELTTAEMGRQTSVSGVMDPDDDSGSQIGHIREFIELVKAAGGEMLVSGRLTENAMWTIDDMSNARKVGDVNGWHLYSWGECAGKEGVIRKIAKESDLEDAVFVQWFFRGSGERSEQSYLAKRWMELFGRATIPYDLDERRKVLAGAYEELGEYVKKWEERKRRGD